MDATVNYRILFPLFLQNLFDCALYRSRTCSVLASALQEFVNPFVPFLCCDASMPIREQFDIGVLHGLAPVIAFDRPYACCIFGRLILH